MCQFLLIRAVKCKREDIYYDMIKGRNEVQTNTIHMSYYSSMVAYLFVLMIFCLLISVVSFQYDTILQ